VKTLPKTLSPAYPEKDLNSMTRFQRLCSRRYRARSAGDEDAKRKQQNGGKERGLLKYHLPPFVNTPFISLRSE
jgi:hypothetical protein